MKPHDMKLVALAAPLMVLTACTVGPDYVRPTVEAPAAFKETAGWKPAQPRDEELKGKWWEAYNDPLLNSLEEQVNISNQNLAQAEAQYRQAQALVQSARASYFPTVSTSASESRSQASSSFSSKQLQSTNPVTRGILNNYLLTLDATWEPDLWGKVRRTVESNVASAQASFADLEAARLSAQTDLAQDYIQLRALDSEKQLLDDTVAAYEKSVQLTQNQYAAGVVAKTDVVQAETQLKSTQAQSIDVGVQRAQFEHAIALLIGKPASVFSIPPAPLTASLPAVPIGVPSDLLERRPDVAAAERMVASANAQIGVAIAAYFPTLTLSASGGFQSPSWSNWLTVPSRFWAVGPQLAETLFDGGLRRAQTAQARAAYDANVAAYRQTVLNGFKEVEDNLAALRILEQEAQVQDQAVQDARLSVVLTTNQYKAGTVNYLNVIVVQAAALNNETTAVSILSRRLLASVLLIKAIGGGWNSSDLPTTAYLTDPK
ncbi:MAG TPA: efflux transporter outer membrane subunit [Burkholderiales bacterium]|nr:efflux transporter outer membrane subunit [Burkholderiales bacterium]